MLPRHPALCSVSTAQRLSWEVDHCYQLHFADGETEAQRGRSLVQGYTAHGSGGAGFEFLSFGLQYPSFSCHMGGHTVVLTLLMSDCSGKSPRIQKLY